MLHSTCCPIERTLNASGLDSRTKIESHCHAPRRAAFLVTVGDVGQTIGRAADAAGVGVETIRFYEREQLIERPPKPVGSGPRRYSPELVRRIRFIQETQRLGFTLPEVRELLALEADAVKACPDVAERAAVKLAEIRHKIRQLRRLADALKHLSTSS